MSKRVIIYWFIVVIFKYADDFFFHFVVMFLFCFLFCFVWQQIEQ